MLKKIFILSLILIITLGSNCYSQPVKSKIPYFIKADVFEKYPGFEKLPLYGKLKHYPTSPEDLKFKPEQTRFLGETGVEMVNVSSMWKDAQSETWIAINPTDPNNIICTANDNAYLGGEDGFRMSAFVTTDGGVSWFHSATPRNTGQWITPVNGAATIFDPSVSFDSKGNVYYCYGFAQTHSGVQSTEQNGVFVVKSTDKGITWSALKNGSPNGIMAITQDAMAPSGNPFHDRYILVADANPTSKYKDNVYCFWRCFGGAADGMVFSRSTDGGENWSNYIKIASNGQHAHPTIGANGEVLLTWTGSSSTAMFSKSIDGGVNFSPAVEVQKVYSIGNYDPSNGRNGLKDKQNIRVSSCPAIAADISNSPYRGYVYIVQAGREKPDGDYGIYLATSTNGGQTFTKKNVRIDDNPLRNDLFFPNISVDPVTGLLSVFYYSSQNDPKNQGVDGYVALSKDGGSTWKYVRVSSATKYLNNLNTVFPQGSSGGIYWGDYTSITSYNNRVYPLYWLPTNGNSFGSCDLFTAFISPAPQAPTNLAFEPKSNPTSIKISWTHPTKNLLGEALADFKINVYRGAVIIGQVQKAEAAAFTDVNVTLGQQYTYRLQTELPNGDKSIFAEISGMAGGSPKPMPPTEFTWRPVPTGILIMWKSPDKNIEGFQFIDKLKLNLYDASTNNIIKTFDDTQIQAGVYSSMLLTIDTRKFYNLSIKSVGVRSGVDTESDFASNIVLAYSGAAFTEINEDFDDINNIIPHYSTGNWGTSDEKAKSMPNSLNQSPHSNYGKNINNLYVLPPVILSTGKSSFTFEHISLIDPFMTSGVGDYGEFSYTDDFGKTWKPLKWVDSKTSVNFIPGDVANSQWQPMACNLSQHIGDTLMFRFRISTNGLKEDKGWFIDNIKMDNSPTNTEEDLIESAKVYAYPNPATSYTKVNVLTPVNADLSIQMFDALGNSVFSQNYGMISNGSNNFDIPVNDLTNGIYYFKIVLNNSIKTIPVSVIR
jgi:photosystem II stability/assembly factor-like uncharacterized protein